jgi:hypothetical protein
LCTHNFGVFSKILLIVVLDCSDLFEALEIARADQFKQEEGKSIQIFQKKHAIVKSVWCTLALSILVVSKRLEDVPWSIRGVLSL